MARARSPLVIIFITVFIDLVGFGIVIPVLPLYAERFRASPVVIGLLVSVFSAMQFIFAPILGRLSDRVGRRPVLLVSLIGTAAGFLIMGLAGSLWLLFLARIVDGITGGNISIAQAYIADVTPPDQRSRGMGMIGAAFGLGFIFGPAIAGVMSHISPGAPFLFAAGLSAANAVALYFLLPESLSAEHRVEAARRSSILSVLQKSGSWQLGGVMATYFFATLAFALLTMVYSLFTNKRFGLDATHNGYVFAYLGVLGAAIQGGLLGRLLKVASEKSLAVVGIAVLAASMLALPISTGIAVLIVVSSGVAIGNSFATPTLNGLASKSVGPALQGQVLGTLQSSASLARILGPLIGGWLLDYDLNNHTTRYGRTPFWAGGAIMIIALLIALTLQPARAPEEESGQEQPSGSASQPS
ncbi:MAG TPA: MFS transporter [Blastocatellia bacterium]|nr:MFS transporter [Blastocatellia bacterium]